MSEAVNSVSTKVEPVNSNHAGRNAAIAGGVGLIGGGTAGYMTKQIFKDDKFTDEFVKELKNQIIDGAVFPCDKSELKAVKKGAKALINLGENPEVNKVRLFIKKYGKIMGVPDEKLKLLHKMTDEDCRDLFNKLKQKSSSIIDGLNLVVTGVTKFYDKTKKRFDFTKLCLEDDMAFVPKAVDKSIGKIKGKAGAIWGLTAGAVLAAGTYFVSKHAGNKNS